MSTIPSAFLSIILIAFAHLDASNKVRCSIVPVSTFEVHRMLAMEKNENTNMAQAEIIVIVFNIIFFMGCRQMFNLIFFISSICPHLPKINTFSYILPIIRLFCKSNLNIYVPIPSIKKNSIPPLCCPLRLYLYQHPCNIRCDSSKNHCRRQCYKPGCKYITCHTPFYRRSSLCGTCSHNGCCYYLSCTYGCS